MARPRDTPQNGKLPIPADTVKLCTLCHEAMPGRPSTQPQIEVAQHNPFASGQQCTACHNPHAPKIAAAAVKVTGDAAAGKQRAAACASCHGAEGISPNDTWPNLAGQRAAYLARILAAYKSGDQKDVMMTPIAQALSDADIQNLAAYYASLSCRTVPGTTRVGDAATGKALAKNCAACHGATGISGNPAWPHLAGQKAGYLVNVLKAFRAGLRKDPMMAAVVRGLSDTDIDNLAPTTPRRAAGPLRRQGRRHETRSHILIARAAHISAQARSRRNLRRRRRGCRDPGRRAESRGKERIRLRPRLVSHQGLRLDQAPVGLRRRRDEMHRLPALRRGVQARERRSRRRPSLPHLGGALRLSRGRQDERASTASTIR